MKPVIRNILRCAVYQIKYMNQVPDSAACNEAVNLAIRKGFKNLRGFVNGVPVSYTHLDVYKRQVRHLRLSIWMQRSKKVRLLMSAK